MKQYNPYTAPVADLSATPVNRRHKKPKSAWLMQIICVILGITTCVGITRTMAALLIDGIETFGGVTPRTLSLHLALRVAMLIIVAVVFWGVQSHRAYGRICGGIAIGMVLTWFGYQLLFVEGRPTSNDGEALGEFTAKMLFACGAGYWFYAFCFSPAAGRYFSGDSDETVEHDY